MDWAIINVVCITSFSMLVWGWVTYLQIPTRSDWPSRASLVGLSAPLLSVGLWVVTLSLARIEGWPTSNPVLQRIARVGVAVPILGMLVGLAGRRRLALAVVPTSIGTILFWYGTTVR